MVATNCGQVRRNAGTAGRRVVSCRLPTFEPEILNFARDGVAPETKARGGIDTSP